MLVEKWLVYRHVDHKTHHLREVTFPSASHIQNIRQRSFRVGILVFGALVIPFCQNKDVLFSAAVDVVDDEDVRNVVQPLSSFQFDVD